MGARVNKILERYAVEKLHGDKRFSVMLANVVNGANVGMVQRGSRLCLALKAGQRLGIAGHLVGQELQGHETVQAAVFGLVDHTHPTPAKLLDHAIVRDGLADHRYRC
jgi:hypothetical protein